MKVYLRRKRSSVFAIGEYNKMDNSLVVLAGAILSKDITHSAKFRGANSIEKKRASVKIKDGVLQEDVTFKSPSTAGNFITGKSTDGLTSWKDENGITIKSLMG